MLSATTNTTTFVRNYLILAITVMVMSSGLVESFYNPNRLSQQNRLDNYGRYISAGLVAHAQTLGR
ncbi:conserved hypothetical protein [Rippkaea orientalis PCC 8801]|uniref:Uncharacterized protein n=1 Tax=Rippkaea orientalis (strain PCC 8801 / RF-1) TaxID=41431 RepID=B7K257_RIPO1|nr:hypothetical protein [Rippkaea orientalis]ACK65193.1 conserved hypothetical protein [Rippkaea orientalis PCC 8801]